MKVKKLIKNNPLLYKPIVAFLKYLKKKKRAFLYHKYGIDALNIFVRCMEENNFPYTLAFGSILGAIREGGFIKHDLDIDTFVWIKDFKEEIIKELIKAGFHRHCTMLVKDGELGREDTIDYHGVHIDIFYLYEDGKGLPYCCDFVKEVGMKISERLPRRITLPVSHNRRKVKFENIEVFIPENAEEICEYRYGPSYMTPDPSWHWVSEKNSIIEWRDKISETTIINYD